MSRAGDESGAADLGQRVDSPLSPAGSSLAEVIHESGIRTHGLEQDTSLGAILRSESGPPVLDGQCREPRHQESQSGIGPLHAADDPPDKALQEGREQDRPSDPFAPAVGVGQARRRAAVQNQSGHAQLHIVGGVHCLHATEGHPDRSSDGGDPQLLTDFADRASELCRAQRVDVRDSVSRARERDDRVPHVSVHAPPAVTFR